MLITTMQEINERLDKLGRSLDAAHTALNAQRTTVVELRKRVDKLESRPFEHARTDVIANALYTTLHGYYHTAGEGDIEHALKMAEELNRRLAE